MGSETFELKRFGWATPDRLEIEGTFVGLGATPPGDPVLVLRGADQTHRLPAVHGAADEPAAENWHAEFLWQETPTAFDAAQLELGGELLVDLPEPRWDDEDSDGDVLDVRRRGAPERLRLRSELLAVRSELTEANARLERAEQELARAREDLEAERQGRAHDAERFRMDLAQAQEAAEEALAESDAEVDVLRARMGELTAAGEEAERLQDQLDAIREILDEDTGDRPDAGEDASSP